MRFLKKALLTLILGGLTIATLNCTSASDTAPKYQTVAVPRGNLIIDITAVGNLALSLKEDLAFEIAGTVAEVLVKEGDTVEDGQMLAKLDTSEWEEQLSALEDKVTTAERQLTAKKRALIDAERQPEIKKRALIGAERQLIAKERALIDAGRQPEIKKRALVDAERQLTAKKRALIDAERQLTAKERALTAAQRQPEVKKRNVMAKERDVLQAEINLKNAQTALEEAQGAYTVADFIVAQAEVDAAKSNLEAALQKLSRYEPGSEGYKVYQNLVVQAQSRLNSAQAKLDAMLAGMGTEEIAIKELQVEIAQGKLEEAQEAVSDALIAVEEAQQAIVDAQLAVEDAQQAIADAQQAIVDARIAVEDAQVAVEDAQLAVEDAQQDIADARIAVEDAQQDIADAQLAVKDAQQALDDAKEELGESQSAHLEIIAPFAGFITTVNIDGGDGVKKGAVALTLADPTKFEADILVNEMDIPQIKVGGSASAQVDAMPGLSLPAKVTYISPSATIQSGVVNYKVKVEIESLQSVRQERQPARGNLSADNITSGALPDRMRQAIEAGGFTQEQIEEMRRQRQQGQAALPALPAMIPSDFQLREGQTVTVSILVAERNDVLLVPNSAITRRGMESMVKVLKDGIIEERSIMTGISNWQYTEVTSGLTEGEQVVVPKTATTPTTSQQRGQMWIPGGGGFGR